MAGRERESIAMAFVSAGGRMRDMHEKRKKGASQSVTYCKITLEKEIYPEISLSWEKEKNCVNGAPIESSWYMISSNGRSTPRNAMNLPQKRLFLHLPNPILFARFRNIPFSTLQRRE